MLNRDFLASLNVLLNIYKLLFLSCRRVRWQKLWLPQRGEGKESSFGTFCNQKMKFTAVIFPCGCVCRVRLGGCGGGQSPEWLFRLATRTTSAGGREKNGSAVGRWRWEANKSLSVWIYHISSLQSVSYAKSIRLNFFRIVWLIRKENLPRWERTLAISNPVKKYLIGQLRGFISLWSVLFWAFFWAFPSKVSRLQ